MNASLPAWKRKTQLPGVTAIGPDDIEQACRTGIMPIVEDEPENVQKMTTDFLRDKRQLYRDCIDEIEQFAHDIGVVL